MAITNREIARMLFNIATLLDMAQDNLYRVRAYRRAARRILILPEAATSIVERGEELPLPGVGTRIRRKLGELLQSGSMAFYAELLEDQPRHVRHLMDIEGVGPKIAHRLHTELGATTPEDVIAAGEKGKIRALPGFGWRSEARLMESARSAMSRSSRAA